MKGLYRRKNTWWINFTPAPNAERVYLSLKTSDEAEAIVRARKIVLEAQTEMRQTLGSCASEIDSYLASKKKMGRASSTLSTRGYVLKAFVEAIGAKTPKSITRGGDSKVVRRTLRSRSRSRAYGRRLSPDGSAVAEVACGEGQIIHRSFSWHSGADTANAGTTKIPPAGAS